MTQVNEELLKQLETAQQESFKYIAFSGGGAKGNIYSGVHETLKTSGVLDGVEEVAGSSAGAITAAVVASGITEEDFQKLGQNTNFKNLLGEGTDVPIAGIKINAGGEPLEDLIRKSVSKNVTDYFKNTDILEVCDTRLQEINNELTAIKGNDDQESLDRTVLLEKQQVGLQSISDGGGAKLNEMNKRVQETGKVTFGDLDVLHNLDPIKFKGLIITATNNKTGELMLFNAKDTPNVEIAKAAHASSSIPYVFKPVTIDGVEYADGGCYDNIPLKYFNKQDSKNDIENISDSPDKIQEAKKQGRSLALAFSSSGDMGTDLNTAIYSGKSNITDGFMSRVITSMLKIAQSMGFAKSLTDHVKNNENTYQKVRDNALDTIGLDTKDVGTLSFDGAQEKAGYLHVKGSLQTARHFENHDIGTNQDPNLVNKEFMLQVYEDSHVQKGTLESWKDKIFGEKEVKQNLEPLLDLCKADSWKGKNSQEMLASFVEKAATTSNGKIANNTQAMDKLIKTINSQNTPDSVKMQFAQLAKVEITGKVVDLKLKPSDFDPLLNAQKSQQKDNVNKSKNSVKDIIKNGKAASMEVKIKQEIRKDSRTLGG